MQVNGELFRAMLQISASDLTPTATGLVYFNTTTGPKFYDGTTWKFFADTTSVQTFTNKTLTSPAITTPTGIVKGDVGLGNVDNTSDATKNAATATLTNKTITSQLVTEVSTPSTPASGFVALYAKADRKMYKLDSTGTETEVGAGSGGSGRNYFSEYFDGTKPVGTITNGLTATGNRTTLQTTWAADNTAKLTIANNTTTPLRQTGDFKITHVAVGTAFVESPMVNLDLADLSKAVTLNLDLTGNTLAGDFDIVVMRYNSGGTYQETISVAGTASSGSPASAQLPTGTTKFNGFFISSNTQSDLYSIRFRRLSAVATTSVQFDSFFAGPQSIVTGAIVTDWETDTNIVTQGFGTLASTTIQRQRVGNTIYYRGYLTTGTVTATEARFYLPTGLTIGGIGAATQVVGHGTRDATSIGKLIRILGVSGNNYVTFMLVVDNNTAQTLAVSENGDAICTSSARMLLEFSVPISSWTSNVTLAERAVEEYVFSTATTTTANGSDLVSFGYGLHGAQFNAINSTTVSASTNYRVRCSTAITSTSKLDIEFSRDRINWSPVGTDNAVVRGVSSNTANYGMWFIRVSGSNTDVDIFFGNNGRHAAASTYGGNGGAWSDISGSTFYWRLRKTDGGASVGYPIGIDNLVAKYQKKFLTSNVTTTGDVAALSFNGLVTGKSYRLKYYLAVTCGGANTSMFFKVAHNGVQIATAIARTQTATLNIYLTLPIEVIFTAAASTVVLNVTTAVSSTLVADVDASGTNTSSYAILEEFGSGITSTTAYT